MNSEIFKRALEIQDYMIKVKRIIHQEPELSKREYKTTSFIESELKEMGIEILPLGLKTGVVGLIRGEKSGENKVTALRADIDALPIQELTDIKDKSTIPGVMHACGHDAHTSMLLGASKLLINMKRDFSGAVKLIFQPDEETLMGSAYMIKKGVLENPDVDYILGIHGDSSFHIGEIAFNEGIAMASADHFKVKVKGQSGHGAYPHINGSDAVLAASNTIMGLQSIVTRQVNILDSVVITIGKINGGKANNIIPDTVEFSGTVRCKVQEVRQTMKSRISELANSIATAYGCTAEVSYYKRTPPLVNSARVTKIAKESAKKLVDEKYIKNINNFAMGSEDFSKYLEEIADGTFVRLGIKTPDKKPPVYHDGNFVFPEEVLPYGAALFTQFVLDINS